MNEEAKRRARTQGRFSLDNKWNNKESKRPSDQRLNKSLNQDDDDRYQPRPNFAPSQSSRQPRLSYEGGGASPSVSLPVKCTDFTANHFKKWVILDPSAKKPSLVYYDPNFLHTDEADLYYEMIKTGVDWEQKVQYRDGNAVPVPRLTCWFGPLAYGYGKGISHKPNENWSPHARKLKTKIENYLKDNCDDENSAELRDATFNSVLLNFYRNGKDGVAWHSDDETTMGVCPTIASVSLGETRKFELKRYSGFDAEWRVHLKNGSLLIMSGNTQLDWKHRVPTEYHDKQPRINLTFRHIQPI